MGVGAQSTLRGHDIFARKICIKINKMPEFYMIPARKINKIPEFYMIFARKMPEFYIIIARKIFFPILWGGTCPPCPHSSTPMTASEKIWTLVSLCTLCTWVVNPNSARHTADWSCYIATLAFVQSCIVSRNSWDLQSRARRASPDPHKQLTLHRRRSSVNVRGHDIFARKICMKN